MNQLTLLFDLDGTLIDSSAGIIGCVKQAFADMNLPVPPQSSLLRFIGPPLADSLQRYSHLQGPKADEWIRLYRKHYAATGVFQNTLYPGMADLLTQLHAQGQPLLIATSKPTLFAQQIMENLGLASLFHAICGSEINSGHADKADIIRQALSGLAPPQKQHVWMIGDREHDVIGARKNQIPCIGVLHGFGSQQELEQAGAWKIVPNAHALRQVLHDAAQSPLA